MSLINYFSGFYKTGQNKTDPDCHSDTDINDSPLQVPKEISKKPSFDKIIYEGNHTRISQYFKENNFIANSDFEKMFYLSCDELKQENKEKRVSIDEVLIHLIY